MIGQSGKIQYAIGELVCQHLYAIACAYSDGNDASRLSSDPIQKLLCGRDPIRGEELALQPTLSRFENALHRRSLYRMGVALAETVIDRHRRRLGARSSGSRSIWIRPTIRPMARSSSRSSMATTTPGVICRWPGS
jgi:hypothetical protein